MISSHTYRDPPVFSARNARAATRVAWIAVVFACHEVSDGPADADCPEPERLGHADSILSWTPEQQLTGFAAFGASSRPA
jgi:hypothetical protein